MIKKHSLDEDELRRRGLCFADLSRPPEELAADGLKYYAIAGKRCASTHIQAENIPEDLIDKAVRHLAERRRNRRRRYLGVFYRRAAFGTFAGDRTV